MHWEKWEQFRLREYLSLRIEVATNVCADLWGWERGSFLEAIDKSLNYLLSNGVPALTEEMDQITSKPNPCIKLYGCTFYSN